MTDIPIIAMTAHAMAGDQDKSAAAGMNDHVTKPIDPTQLFSILARWISNTSCRDQKSDEPTISKSPEAESKAGDSGPAPPEDPPFPGALEGFDLSAGLKRLGGNKTFYLKLLKGFVERYSDTAADIRMALDAGNYRQAHSMIHDIKGLAGNISAVHLQEAASELEKRVKRVSEDAPPERDAILSAFNTFETRLMEALQAARTLKTQTPELSPPASTEKPMGMLPPELAAEAAQRLREAAEMGDVSGLKEIGEHYCSRTLDFTPYRNRINALADDFNFEEIVHLADHLAKMTGEAATA